MPVRRDPYASIRARLDADGSRAVALLGPRQVGKSTLLRQLVDGFLDEGRAPGSVIYFPFDSELLRTDPLSIREVVDVAREVSGAESGQSRVFLLDEISRAPDWDRGLKAAVDAARLSKRDRFVVTDSSASILRSGARKSLVGRWDMIQMEGLSLDEFLRVAAGQPESSAAKLLAADPGALARYLEIGGLPEHAAAFDGPLTRERIRNDVAEKLIADLSLHQIDVSGALRLFHYIVRDSGSIFTATKRAGDVDADRRSVLEWARYLMEAMVVEPLDATARRPVAALRSKPRLYAADHAYIQAFSFLPSLTADSDTRGRVFEAVVFRHLREMKRTAEVELSYFRDSGGLEADFVVTSRESATVVEVTSSRVVRAEKIRTTAKVGSQVGATRSLIVHGGAAEDVIGGVELVPLPRFLMNPTKFVLGGNDD